MKKRTDMQTDEGRMFKILEISFFRLRLGG